MKYDFDRIIDRRRCSIKYDDPGKLYPGLKLPNDVIPMWIADMDFACCDTILEAIRERTRRLTLGYENTVTPTYRKAVSGWFKTRHGWDVEEEWICAAGGAVDALDISIRAFTEMGDGVIVQRPVYGPFDATVKKLGRKVVNNSLIYKNGGYSIDLEDLEKKASDPVNKLLAFCNPHNPSCRVWNREELESIDDICRRNGVVIVSDEVHCDIVRHGTVYTPMGSIAPDISLTSTTAGKSFNLSGLHLANIIVPDKRLREGFETERGRWFPSPLAASAAMAAYTCCADWEDEVNSYIDENFLILANRLPDVLPKARLVKPEGMYLAWIDMHGYDLDDRDIAERFVEHAGVVPDPGTHFGPEGEGFIRLNIACPHIVLEKALLRVKKAFEDV